MELDELLGWAESAKATPHQSAALEELDRLLGEFNIDNLDKKLVRPQIESDFHTSENDIRDREPPPALETRVFSDPGVEPDSSAPQFSAQVNETTNFHPNNHLHNFFGKNNLGDDITISDISSITPAKRSSSSNTHYSHSISSSEKASNYTMYSLSNRPNVYQQVSFRNPRLSMLIDRGIRCSDYNTFLGTGSAWGNAGTFPYCTIRASRDDTLRSNSSTLRSNTLQNSSNNTLKSSRRKRRCRFLLCTPVWAAWKDEPLFIVIFAAAFVTFCIFARCKCRYTRLPDFHEKARITVKKIPHYH